MFTPTGSLRQTAGTRDPLRPLWLLIICRRSRPPAAHLGQPSVRSRASIARRSPMRSRKCSRSPSETSIADWLPRQVTLFQDRPPCMSSGSKFNRYVIQQRLSIYRRVIAVESAIAGPKIDPSFLTDHGHNFGHLQTPDAPPYFRPSIG